jgi:hypothetical protein
MLNQKNGRPRRNIRLDNQVVNRTLRRATPTIGNQADCAEDCEGGWLGDGMYRFAVN